jgi:hypothetical protein
MIIKKIALIFFASSKLLICATEQTHSNEQPKIEIFA